MSSSHNKRASSTPQSEEMQLQPPHTGVAESVAADQLGLLAAKAGSCGVPQLHRWRVAHAATTLRMAQGWLGCGAAGNAQNKAHVYGKAHLSAMQQSRTVESCHNFFHSLARRHHLAKSACHLSNRHITARCLSANDGRRQD